MDSYALCIYNVGIYNVVNFISDKSVYYWDNCLQPYNQEKKKDVNG